MMNDDVESSNNGTILAKEETNESNIGSNSSKQKEKDTSNSCHTPQNVTADEKNDLSSQPVPVKSLFCSLPLNKIRAVLGHNKTEEEEAPSIKMKQTSRKLLCLYCDRTFVSLNLRHKHVERCHSEKQNRRLSSRKLQSQFTTTACFHCDKLPTGHSLRQLFEHLISSHPQKYFGCLICEERFLNQSTLIDHNSMIHRDTVSLQQKVRLRKDVENRSKNDYNVDDALISQTLTRSMTREKDSTQNSSRQSRNNKKISIKASKIGLRKNKRLQTVKVPVRKKKNKTAETAKLDVPTTMKLLEKSKVNSVNPYPEFDHNYRVKKITDHSIDNLKISSLTFDDVFDKAFFNKIKCNIQENLMYHLDGKLFKNEESESRISNFEKNPPLDNVPSTNTENYGCDLTLNAITPVTSILTQNFGEDLESQIEYGSKPSKKKLQPRQDPIRHKYVTRRKYQASILEHKENRDLSKLDMWTQLVIKERQQKVINDKKSAKEMLEYTACEEYKKKVQRHELNRILDRRGPFEDLREESSKKAALEKLNAETNHEISEECFEEVKTVIDELLNEVVRICSDSHETEISIKLESERVPGEKQDIPDLPEYLNLRRTLSLQSEEVIDKSDKIVLICSAQDTENYELPTNTVRLKNEMIELSGEWARSRLYICAACGLKLPNIKLLLEHKSLYHQNAWVQHYELVGSQSELYRHLCIPGLGKVGYVEETVPCKLWRRSEARQCTKCEKMCNSLGELHRHVLECGGDWTWMLARKKCKYRPFGSRKKKRGLVKRIRERINQAKTEQAEDSEKKKVKKQFEGPRQRPSDADTIERMLANLPAKRSSRKIICLKDGFPRNLKNKNNKKAVMKCGKVVMQKPAFNNEQSHTNPKNHKKTTRSMKNINRTLSSKILDTNSKLRVKRQLMKNMNRRSTRRISMSNESSQKKNSQENKKSKVENFNDEKIIKNDNSKRRNGLRNLMKDKMNIKNFFPVSKRINTRKIAVQDSSQGENKKKSASQNVTDSSKTNRGNDPISINSSTDQLTANKRRLRSNFKKVIDRVKKLKLDTIAKTPNEKPADNFKVQNSFLGQEMQEKEKMTTTIPVSLLEEPKENSLSIPAFVQNAMNSHSPTEESLTPENIFNLEHNSENLLQAKSPMENLPANAVKIIEPKIVATDLLCPDKFEIKSESMIAESNEKEKTSLLNIDTCSKSEKSPLVSPLSSPSMLSPKNKGKMRKPNRGLNDCIAMLTKKAFEAKKPEENEPKISEPIVEENKNVAHNNFRENEGILKIPVIETESKNLQSEVLDLSKPKNIDVKAKIWNPILSPISEKAILKIPKPVDVSWNSIDEIIQKVVENRCSAEDVQSITNFSTRLKIPTVASHSSVDNIIEEVVKGTIENFESDENSSEKALTEKINELFKKEPESIISNTEEDEEVPLQNKEIQTNVTGSIEEISPNIAECKTTKKNIGRKTKRCNKDLRKDSCIKPEDVNIPIPESVVQNEPTKKDSSEISSMRLLESTTSHENSEKQEITEGAEKNEPKESSSAQLEQIVEPSVEKEKQAITDSEDDLPLVVLRSKSRSENIISESENGSGENKEIEKLSMPQDNLKDSISTVPESSEDDIKQNIENIETLCNSGKSPLNKLITGELPFAVEPEKDNRRTYRKRIINKKSRKCIKKTNKRLSKIEIDKNGDLSLQQSSEMAQIIDEETPIKCDEINVLESVNAVNKDARDSPALLMRVTKLKSKKKKISNRGLVKPKLILKLPRIILKEPKLKIDSLKPEQPPIEISETINVTENGKTVSSLNLLDQFTIPREKEKNEVEVKSKTNKNRRRKKKTKNKTNHSSFDEETILKSDDLEKIYCERNMDKSECTDDLTIAKEVEPVGIFLDETDAPTNLAEKSEENRVSSELKKSNDLTNYNVENNIRKREILKPARLISKHKIDENSSYIGDDILATVVSSEPSPSSTENNDESGMPSMDSSAHHSNETEKIEYINEEPKNCEVIAANVNLDKSSSEQLLIENEVVTEKRKLKTRKIKRKKKEETKDEPSDISTTENLQNEDAIFEKTTKRRRYNNRKNVSKEEIVNADLSVNYSSDKMTNGAEYSSINKTYLDDNENSFNSSKSKSDEFEFKGDTFSKLRENVEKCSPDSSEELKSDHKVMKSEDEILELSVEEKIFVETNLTKDSSPVRKQRTAKAKALENINFLEYNLNELDSSETRSSKKKKGNKHKNNSSLDEIQSSNGNTEKKRRKSEETENHTKISRKSTENPDKAMHLQNTDSLLSDLAPSSNKCTKSGNKLDEETEAKLVEAELSPIENVCNFNKNLDEILDEEIKSKATKRGRSAKTKALVNLKETSILESLSEPEKKQSNNKKLKSKQFENIIIPQSDNTADIDDCYDINKIDEDINLNATEPIFSSGSRNRQQTNTIEHRSNAFKAEIQQKIIENSSTFDDSINQKKSRKSKVKTLEDVHDTLEMEKPPGELLSTSLGATAAEINTILKDENIDTLPQKETERNVENESVTEDLESKRRSRRACKVNTYNENELVEAIFQHVPSEKEKAKKKEIEEKPKKKEMEEKPKKKEMEEKPKKKEIEEKQKEKKLNNDELFDMLKATSTFENPNVPKYFPDDGETRDNLTDDNFDDVFDDILKKSEALFGEKTNVFNPDDLSDTSKSSDNIQYFKQTNNKKAEFKDNTLIASDLYCDICNKSFKRSDNLVKHKTTLTHISKLSEIEAREAEKAKAVQENSSFEKDCDNSRLSEAESLYSYPPTPGSEALKIAEILTNSFEKSSSEANENRKYKSLGERKSFESEPGNQKVSENIIYEPQICKNAGVMLEKQITLLQNIIENRGMDYIDDVSVSSYHSLDNGITMDSLTVDDSRNFIFSSSADKKDGFLKPTQLDEISDDSLNTRIEDNKSRKVLNRDEELFLECCSLLKSSSEISNFSKKSNKTTTLKISDEPDIFKQSKNSSNQIIDFSSDNSEMASTGSFCERSNSDTSNWDVGMREKQDFFNAKDLGNSEEAQEGHLRDAIPTSIQNPFDSISEITNSEESSVESKNDFSTKMPTKGALKVFEGLKVSIPTGELDLEEVLSNSPPMKKSNIPGEKQQFSMPRIPKISRKSKPTKNKQLTDDKFVFKVNKNMKDSETTDVDKEFPDIYDFEETQDNTERYPKPDLKTHKIKANGDDMRFENNSEGGQTLSSSSSSTFSINKQTESTESITKKKHMIMGKIFKNAIKPKTDEDIREIPPLDHNELVESYVLSCSPGHEDFKKPKMTEEEMNYLFDKLLDETKKQQNDSKSKMSNIKKKLKIRKRGRSNSNSTDDEFGINELVKKKPNRKKVKDNSINLEQELKECIGVASRKSQRKCTSGKQNVLVEYWSSDESAFETFLENHLQGLTERSEASVLKNDNYVNDEIKPTKTKTKQIGPSKKRTSTKKNISSSEFSKQHELNNCRRKRLAANPLYHWSSSSDDETQDLIEVKSIRDYPEDEYDEDRPIQHGWIVGDSPKKLVTMLAQAKGKKTESESSVKEQGKRRSTST